MRTLALEVSKRVAVLKDDRLFEFAAIDIQNSSTVYVRIRDEIATVELLKRPIEKQLPFILDEKVRIRYLLIDLSEADIVRQLVGVAVAKPYGDDALGAVYLFV